MATKYLASISVLLFAIDASASVLYHYEGANYVDIFDGPTAGVYTTAMKLEFKLQLAAPLSPNRIFDGGTGRDLEFWSVSDGRHYWDSIVSGPFEDYPPWVPHFLRLDLQTNNIGDIAEWEIEFGIQNFYPEEHPVPAVHLIYSKFPPFNPESPVAIYDTAKVWSTEALTIDFDDMSYTERSGNWRMTQVVPLPSAGWLFLGCLSVVSTLRKRSHRLSAAT